MSSATYGTNRIRSLLALTLGLTLFAAAALSCADAPAPSQPAAPQPGATSPSSDGPPGMPASSAEEREPVEWRADGIVTPGEYSDSLDRGTYRLFWSSTESTIRIAMEADTQG